MSDRFHPAHAIMAWAGSRLASVLVIPTTLHALENPPHPRSSQQDHTRRTPMNDWYSISIMAQEHRNDLRREALTEQMLREAFRMDARQRSVRCRLLCRLGRELIALGVRLQEVYGGATDTAALRPAHPGPA
jgi:hypothetical protein